MLPRTLSASSLQVAALCMVRWKAEYMDRVPSVSNSAADIGTACHGGLEKYVKLVYIDKTHEPGWQLLKGLYDIAYIETFGNADTDTPEYVDGLAMVQKWFKRTDFDGVEVLSVEDKEPMEIPVEYQGQRTTVTFNYIMDRLDRLGEGHYRVVDYKSIRVPIDPEDLENKIQARVYALAVQRKFPDAKKVQVVFDLLRHNPVGVVFSFDENMKTAHYIMAEAQRIVDTDETTIRPNLNMECGYCVVKASCSLMQTNIAAGGIHSLTSDERVDLTVKLQAQAKGIKILLEELDDLLLREAHSKGVLDWTTENGKYDVEVKVPNRRAVDSSAVARILGPELFGKLGTITLGKLDDIVKDLSVDESIREEVKKQIYMTNGNLQAKIKEKKTIV